jgi:D-tyrosyl-tRNA(Tyr) deacylase
MKVVLQRVSQASVSIDGTVVGAIERGFCLLVGFTDGDGPDQVRWMADKVVGLRVFSDEHGKMNLALADVGGAVLVVSQFTLYGEVEKGRRPSFLAAARPEVAIPLYESFLTELRRRGVRVESGEFGAMMQVALVNDGPVTLILERASAQPLTSDN